MADLLKETLDEEGEATKKLTQISATANADARFLQRIAQLRQRGQALGLIKKTRLLYTHAPSQQVSCLATA
jgi:hypothetical protein